MMKDPQKDTTFSSTHILGLAATKDPRQLKGIDSSEVEES